MTKTPNQFQDDYADNFFTLHDLERRLKVQRQWIIKNIINPGLVPYRKIGTLYFIRKDKFDEWLGGDDRPNATPS